jgi:hypothetical protein
MRIHGSSLSLTARNLHDPDPPLRSDGPLCAAAKLPPKNPVQKSLKIDFLVNNQFVELCIFRLAAAQQSSFSSAAR